MAGKKVDKIPLGTGMLDDAAKKIRDRKRRMAEELAETKAMSIGTGWGKIHGKRERKRWKEGK